MKPKLTLTLVLCAGVAAGAVGERLIRSRDRSDPALVRRLDALAAEMDRLPERNNPPSPREGHPPGIGRTELSRLLDDKLGGLTRSQQAASPKESAPGEVPPTPAQTEALSRAQDLVDQRLQDGRWTDEDGTLLRQALAQAPLRAREDLLRKLVIAINQDRLKIETKGFPF